MSGAQVLPCLALETSGRMGSVALGRGDELLEVATLSADRRHAVELLPTVDALCRRHHVAPGEVAAVYVSGGPGSFTGLRIGITFAKTAALGGRARVVRVPTLDVMAQNALRADDPPTHVVVVLDAKRGRVYAAAFEREGEAPGEPGTVTARQEARPPGEWVYTRLSDPAEVEPAAFLAGMPAGSVVLGEGVVYHREAVAASGLRILPEEYHRAQAEIVYLLGGLAAAAGRYDDPATLTPIYVRCPEAEEVYERRHFRV